MRRGAVRARALATRSASVAPVGGLRDWMHVRLGEASFLLAPWDMAPRSKPTRDRARIERDLERLGVSESLRDALVRRLEELSPSLSEDAYHAALAGVVAA